MTAHAAQCKCGVHGFAMNPYVSLPVATTPYYREARVTFPRRQTACRMRHCCARRIDKIGNRRKLGCTSTRSAERQRMIEVEANRIAALNAAKPRVGSAIGKHCSSSSCSLAMEVFLLGFQRGHSLLRKRMAPLTRAAPAALPLPPRQRDKTASLSVLKSGRNALRSHPSPQRRRTLSPSFTSKAKMTASSVCALTR